MKKLNVQNTLFLIDGSSFLYRAYYGLRPLHTSKGVQVQAVYGFVRMIKKLMNQFDPLYMAVVWDSPGKTVRHEQFEQYKATRQAPPSDLFEQKKLINRFNKFIGLYEVTKPAVEADDLLYSITQDAIQEGMDVVLITSDKDMGQMLNEHVYIYDSFKETLYDQVAFQEKLGVSADKLPFYYALVGDSSDNIPGVHGIGQKGALELINQFTSLEDLYNNLDRVAKPRVQKMLEGHKADAFLSYELFLLRYHALHLSKKDLLFDASQWVGATPLFQELEFKSLLQEVASVPMQQSLFDQPRESANAPSLLWNCVKIVTTQALDELVIALQHAKVCAIDTETTGLDLRKDTIIGISCAIEVGTAYYIPFGHKTDETQLPQDMVLKTLKPVLEDPLIKKYMHHAVFDKAVFWYAGIDVQSIVFDTLIAAKLTNKGWQKSGLKELSERYLDQSMLSFEQVMHINGCKNFSYVPLDAATSYAASDAHQTLQLQPILLQELKKEQEDRLFDLIEQPLQPILFKMQETGIYVDVSALLQLSKQVAIDLQELEEQILVLAGEQHRGINLNSPRQVEQLLFHHLKLKPQKKTKEGYSTDTHVLQSLAKEHPIPSLIARYRELAKLKNTYIDALPTFVNPRTGKIHTTFSQTSVATGRLSSFDPNLQNIPTVGDEDGYGSAIRAAFTPDKGYCFISADYSQIELRVLAYLSQDKILLNAFTYDADIHKETASYIFQVAVDQVTHVQRQIGKRINFSVLYGLTPYGLSKDLNIPFKDAKAYIDAYFAKYTGVKQWMDTTVEDTKRNGYVTTLYGRRRYLPAIYESNQMLYQEAVRVAINTAAQGTAAEVMKLGMIKFVDSCKREQKDAQILLQIHDELLISAHKQEKDMEQFIRTILEHVVDWNVPLKVVIRAGDNWKEVSK